MKISVVTVSFNQAQFLERTIRSVLAQTYKNYEYIIVDPGSTDGSRDIIERYRASFSHVVLQKDRGAADGLNNGFSHATGEIFFYLNSDDTIPPHAFDTAIRYFRDHPRLDVIRGHAWSIDAEDRRLRRIWSDAFDLKGNAYGVVLSVQQSTYIKADAFRRTGGFNIANKAAWDAELLVDLALAGTHIGVVNDFIGNFRIHAASISSGGSTSAAAEDWKRRSFEKVMGRPRSRRDRYVFLLKWFERQIRNPKATIERLLHGASI